MEYCNKIAFIDLFAGAGGLSEGFINAGFTPIAHVEMNEQACSTLKTRACFYFLKESGKIDRYYAYLKGQINKEELYALVPKKIIDSVICETMNEATMNSVYEYIDKAMVRNILANPFKRFEDMQRMRHTRTLGIIQVDESVWKHLNDAEKAEIGQTCDKKLDEYYSRLK